MKQMTKEVKTSERLYSLFWINDRKKRIKLMQESNLPELVLRCSDVFCTNISIGKLTTDCAFSTTFMLDVKNNEVIAEWGLRSGSSNVVRPFSSSHDMQKYEETWVGICRFLYNDEKNWHWSRRLDSYPRGYNDEDKNMIINCIYNSYCQEKLKIEKEDIEFIHRKLGGLFI